MAAYRCDNQRPLGRFLTVYVTQIEVGNGGFLGLGIGDDLGQAIRAAQVGDGFGQIRAGKDGGV